MKDGNLKQVRWKQRYQNWLKSYKLLNSNLKGKKNESLDEVEKAGIIQFFEINFELSWKTIKDYMESEGYLPKSPRECLKLAGQNEVIENVDKWLTALENRNLTSHLYDEKVVNKILDFLTINYLSLASDFKKFFDKKNEG